MRAREAALERAGEVAEVLRAVAEGGTEIAEAKRATGLGEMAREAIQAGGDRECSRVESDCTEHEAMARFPPSGPSQLVAGSKKQPSTSKAEKEMEGEKAERQRRHRAGLTMSKPLYENCRMMSREGEVLCFIDRRKAEWYLGKGLADKVEEGEQLTIRLRFAHKTSDQEQGLDQFYAASKENRCVGCGKWHDLLRYRVVPSCYRRWYPVEKKSHRSHDVVLLCVECHVVAYQAAERLKRELAEEHGVPLGE